VSEDRLTLIELMILMAVEGLGGDGERAYGAAIAVRIKEQTGEDVPLQTIYDSLRNLEQKRWIATRRGEPTAKRGGRAPILCTISVRGVAVVEDRLRAIDFMRNRRKHPNQGVAHA
jgi:DNA-binding PadR family transcriptional regulator